MGGLKHIKYIRKKKKAGKKAGEKKLEYFMEKCSILPNRREDEG